MRKAYETKRLEAIGRANCFPNGLNIGPWLVHQSADLRTPAARRHLLEEEWIRPRALNKTTRDGRRDIDLEVVFEQGPRGSGR